jgi:hypothetical protein
MMLANGEVFGVENRGRQTSVPMLMPVRMVCIGEMRMRMGHGFMAMVMRVLRAGRDDVVMVVLMMFVMRVFVFVFDRLMVMCMFVIFAQVQPNPDRH